VSEWWFKQSWFLFRVVIQQDDSVSNCHYHFSRRRMTRNFLHWRNSANLRNTLTRTSSYLYSLWVKRRLATAAVFITKDSHGSYIWEVKVFEKNFELKQPLYNFIAYAFSSPGNFVWNDCFVSTLLNIFKRDFLWFKIEWLRIVKI